MTMTGEPYQPVRLFYSVPDVATVERAFRSLRCIVKADDGWVWNYEEEAERLKFPVRRREIPPEVHPLLLGHFRMVDARTLVLQVRSVERAVLAAPFFAPALGVFAVLRRMRIVNRLFAAHEAKRGLPHMDKTLDMGVVRVDDPKAPMRADIPLVEDFPLAPEEETPRFDHLAITLRLRAARAFEHWNGNRVTLETLIHRLVEEVERGVSLVGEAP